MTIELDKVPSTFYFIFFFLKSSGIFFHNEIDGVEIQIALVALTNQMTVPNIFIEGRHVGGYDSLVAWFNRY